MNISDVASGNCSLGSGIVDIMLSGSRLSTWGATCLRGDLAPDPLMVGDDDLCVCAFCALSIVGALFAA